MSAAFRQHWALPTLCHVPVDADRMTDRLPAGCAPDLLDGSAWASVVALRIGAMRWRGVPLPGEFAQVNVRTYVVRDGEPGVVFLGLFNPSRAACFGARTLWKLPYRRAEVALVEAAPSGTRLCSVRCGAARFSAEVVRAHEWDGAMDAARAAWFCERYTLFVSTGRGTGRASIGHAPWALTAGRAEFEDDGFGALAGLPQPLTGRWEAHLAGPVVTHIGALERVT